MKYTVVIRQPVPEAALAPLVQELSQQFELTADQAAKLASRRSGRLMKPTSRKRAERLLMVFQSVSAQVTLEEVRDDTTLMRDPFAGERPGLVGPATLPISTAPPISPGLPTSAGSPMPGAAIHTGHRVEPDPAPMGSRYAENDYLPGNGYIAQSRAAQPTPYGSGPLMTGGSDLPASGFSAASASGSDWNSTGVATLSPVQTRPVHAPITSANSVISARPATSGSDGATSLPYSPSHLDALLPTDALEPLPAFVQHDAEMIAPTHLQSGVPEMNLGLPGAPAPVSEPISDDAWADFTGSLGSGAAAPVNEVGNATSVMTVDTSLDPVRGARRSSLARRVLLSTLLPLGLFTLVTLGFLVYDLPRAQRQLITENAQAVAVAVGSNLDVTDQNTVYAQLDALIKRSSVGFVQVNLPDGTTFFRSKNAYTDGPLSEQIAAWVQQHPDNSTFVQSGSAADSYRYQLSLLEQVGAGDSDQAKALRTSVADPANQKSSTTTYLLSSINVTQNAQAERVVAQGIKPSAGTPLYSIVVGVPGDAAFALLRKTLLLVLGVALVAFVIAALLAARTARVVVQPIERLVRAADAISMGDLDRPVTVERNDEIGDLAQALERMRLSLEAAMERLRRRRKGI